MAGVVRADLTRREVVYIGAEKWLESPTAGVWRRPLDRDGGEVARATTIVRFDAGNFICNYATLLLFLQLSVQVYDFLTMFMVEGRSL